MTIDLCNIDWVAISAIATLIMAIATFITLTQNRKQLKELKYQWEEEHKAQLVLSVILLEGELYVLKIQNIGKGIAYNIKLIINEDFINHLLFDEAKEILKNLAQTSLTLLPNECRLFPISPKEGMAECSVGGNEMHYGDDIDEQLDIIKDYPIRINGKYNNQIIDESLTINEFFKYSLHNREGVSLELHRINKNLIELKKHIESISKSVKTFSK